MSTITVTDLTEEQATLLEDVLPKIEQLEQELQEEHPGIDNWLKVINQDLRQYPELVHLLTREQRKVIYTALRKKTDVQISVKTARSKGRGKAIIKDGKMAADFL